MYIEKLAANLNRQDEQPNIEVAEMLVSHEDKEGVLEIVQGLKQKKAIANDCIKVLYEVGERNPQLIADYAASFLDALLSKNNRLVWGAMTALVMIADDKADEIFQQIDKVIYAYKNGSVITIDNSISVFAKLCRADKKYEKELLPLLIEHLSTCRPKEVAQHSERAAICITDSNRELFIETLENRKQDLTPPQTKRVDKLIKKLKA